VLKIKKFLLFICFYGLVFSFGVGASEKEEVFFKKCIDGDTAIFILNNEEIKVRFLAIDTPESVSTTKEWTIEGEMASVYTCDKITNAKIIELEFDPKSNKTDKYGRYLAWIWVDKNLLQEELLSLGYGKVEYIYGDYLYLERLYSAEETAKKSELGIWENRDKSKNEEKEKIIDFFDLSTILLVLFLLYMINKSAFKKFVRIFSLVNECR